MVEVSLTTSLTPASPHGEGETFDAEHHGFAFFSETNVTSMKRKTGVKCGQVRGEMDKDFLTINFLQSLADN